MSADPPEPLLRLPGALGAQSETYRRNPTLIVVPKAARTTMAPPVDTPGATLESSAFPLPAARAGLEAARAAKRAEGTPARVRRAALLKKHVTKGGAAMPGPADYGELTRASDHGVATSMGRAQRMASAHGIGDSGDGCATPGPGTYTPKLGGAREAAPRAVVSSRLVDAGASATRCGPGPAGFVPRRTQGQRGADFGRGSGTAGLPPKSKGIANRAALQRWVAVMKAPTMTVTDGGLELDARR